MIISHSRPEILWTPVNASFITPQERLTNGRPTSTTRLLVDGSFALTGSLGAETAVPLLAGLVNVTLDEGTLVTCDYKRTGDGGYGYQSSTQPVLRHSDGSKSVWFGYAEGLDAVTDIRFNIPLVSVPTDGLYLDIGEVWFGTGNHYNIKPTYGEAPEQFSSQQLSATGQPYPVERTTAIKHTIEVTAFRYPQGYTAPGNVRRLISALSRFRTCAIVPIVSTMFDGSYVIDPAFVNRHGALCYASDMKGMTLDSQHFGAEFTFFEMPRTV